MKSIDDPVYTLLKAIRSLLGVKVRRTGLSLDITLRYSPVTVITVITALHDASAVGEGFTSDTHITSGFSSEAPTVKITVGPPFGSWVWNALSDHSETDPESLRGFFEAKVDVSEMKKSILHRVLKSDS